MRFCKNAFLPLSGKLIAMELTRQQTDILNATGNIRINAVAGSGKTTTVIEYARRIPKNKTILYLAFNKSVRLEAQQRFQACGLTNVRIETAHSLAYSHVVVANRYSLKSNGYSIAEIVQTLQIGAIGDALTEYVIANHVARFMSYYCNSDKQSIKDLDYTSVITDGKAREFVKKHYRLIESKTALLLQLMDKGSVAITHDFYLKKFQLIQPKLKYDYILFDEGQDASPAMLDVFLRQDAVKVIVGDTHQQIYGWRYAVNSLEKVTYKNYLLSESFRFGNDVALLASTILGWKKHLVAHEPVVIRGMGKPGLIKTRAVLARTNMGLLLKAIELIRGPKKINRIYFEGNFNSYTYADEGASLYDVLNLYLGKKQLVRDPLIARMGCMEDLEDYIDKTEDKQLSMMTDIVKKYGDQIPAILREIKAKHVPDHQRSSADIIFSTVHRCKGMEYDSVELVDDFYNEEHFEKLTINETEPFRMELLLAEVNLLYVAVTRARCELHIPESLVPEDFPSSKFIHVLKKKTESTVVTAEEWRKATYGKSVPEGREEILAMVRSRSHKPAANKTWSRRMDDELMQMFQRGEDITKIAEKTGRTKWAIMARIRLLEMIND
jgi:hypothetical protein